jgi:serine phosphatase RsbU (regulator of sigma subunit)
MRRIGACYSGLHDLKNALKSFNESIDLYKVTNNLDESESKGITRTILEIADAYKFNSDFKSAIISYKDALEMARKIDGFRGVQFQCLNRIGNTYRDAKNYDSALVYILGGLKLAETLNDERMIMQSEFSLVKIYNIQGKYATAKNVFSDEKYKKYKLSYGLNRDMIDIENYYFKIDSALGFHKEALNHYMKYKQLYEKFNNEDLSKQAVKEKYQEDFEKQESEQIQKDLIANKEKQKQQLILWAVISGLALLAVFAVFIYNRFKVTKKQNKIISEQKVEVEEQKHLVEEKQKEIVDSITYAKRLQQAILPPHEFFDKHIPNNFILYKPKDIVAGDFYWAEEIGNLIFIAAADSTGHGVPGAMVSVVCSNALNRAVKEFDLIDTGKILDKTRELVVETFAKSNAEVKDGMDISLLCIDKQNSKIYWSGANNPLWYICSANENDSHTELVEVKADKQPIGKTDNPKPFTTQQLEYKENTTFYLFTDGLADQFGGPKGKKFKYKQFEELLISINEKAMQEQSNIINEKFKSWKGELEQVDDVCVIGVKI